MNRITRTQFRERVNGTKIRVDGKSKELQSQLFRAGIYWRHSKTDEFCIIDPPFLFVNYDNNIDGLTINFDFNEDYFNAHGNREITADEILGVDIITSEQPLTDEQKRELALWIAERNNGVITGSLALREWGVNLGRPCNDIDILVNDETLLEGVDLPPLVSPMQTVETDDDGYCVHARYDYFGTKIELMLDEESREKSFDYGGKHERFALVEDILKVKKGYLETDTNKDYIEKNSRDIEITEKWMAEHPKELLTCRDCKHHHKSSELWEDPQCDIDAYCYGGDTVCKKFEQK